MKRLFPVAVIGCALLSGLATLARAAGAQSVAPATARAVQREIQPLLDDELVAANAHDTDRFLRAYLHDSTLVTVFNGVITTGFARVREIQLKAWNNGRSDVVYSQNGPVNFMVLTPDVAVVTEALTSRRTLPSGEVKSAGFAVTTVWHKLPVGWRMVETHESTVH